MHAFDVLLVLQNSIEASAAEEGMHAFDLLLVLQSSIEASAAAEGSHAINQMHVAMAGPAVPCCPATHAMYCATGQSGADDCALGVMIVKVWSDEQKRATHGGPAHAHACHHPTCHAFAGQLRTQPCRFRHMRVFAKIKHVCAQHVPRAPRMHSRTRVQLLRGFLVAPSVVCQSAQQAAAGAPGYLTFYCSVTRTGKACTAFSTAQHGSAAAKDLITTMLATFRENRGVLWYDVIWNVKG